MSRSAASAAPDAGGPPPGPSYPELPHPELLRTARLQLHPWGPDDFGPLAKIHADPVVMELFPSVLSRAESDRWAGRAQAYIDRYGTGPWAVSALGSDELLGAVGVFPLSDGLPTAPGWEVGWRLRADCWGQGLATEAAGAALDHAFAVLGVDEIVAFTFVGNRRSRAVMTRLGMTYAPELDFVHPELDATHPLRHHVLYRLPRADWPGAADPAPTTGTGTASGQPTK